ncbi:CENPJ protein, partial [Oreotrochilus melanogaster]|nr:CENPJ protein [Oreotrochilus melanogaster]
MQMGTHEKKADCALAEWDTKAQTGCEAKVVEQSAGGKEVVGGDEGWKENPAESPQRRKPETLQSCPERVPEMNLQVGEERKTHQMDSVGQGGRTGERPVEGSLQKDLDKMDHPLEGHLTEGVKNLLEVLQKNSSLQDLEEDDIQGEEWSAGPALPQGQKWGQVWPQELVSGSQSSENKRQIHPGFKVVNDKIVKTTHGSPEAVQKGNPSSALQHEWQRKGRAALAWPVAPSSSDSSCSPSSRDDDPKCHHTQYPPQPGGQGVAHPERHLDLSEGDYASDEPSGAEKMSAQRYPQRSPPRKEDIQTLSRQEGPSCSTSSSDSSTGDVRTKGTRAHSSLQQSPFHLTRPKRRDHESESKKKNRARDAKSTSSAVTGDISGFKIKETPSVEGPQKKLFTESLDVFAEETQNILTRGLETGACHRETPSVTRVREEQESRVDFHSRTPLEQLKSVRSQELTHPWEYNRAQTLQKETIAHSKGTGRATGENVKAEEIQELKQQIVGLQEELKRNESCWHAAYTKLRDQVEMLTRQNVELHDELRGSGYQRRKAGKPPEVGNFMNENSVTPVAAAILRETASPSREEEKSWRENHRSISRVGPRTSLQKHFFQDVNTKV